MYFTVPEWFLERTSKLSDEGLLRMIHPNFGSKFIQSHRELRDLIKAELDKHGYDKHRIKNIYHEWQPRLSQADLKNTKLPVSLDNVEYYSNIFRKNWLAPPLSGDLIITKQVVYFFPHMIGASKEKGTEHLGLIGAAVDAAMAAKNINRSRLRHLGLWRDGDNSEMLQARLDAYLNELKEANACWEASEVSRRSIFVKLFLEDSTGRSWLPYPLRLTRDEIKSISSAKNICTIDAPSDTHIFKVGRSRRKYLEQVLGEAGWKTA